MAYSNYIIDYTQIDSPFATEPVNLNEAKLYCRVSNFVDDDQIELMIKQGRQAVEVGTGLSIINKSVEIWFNNIDGEFELPFGPIVKSSLILYDDQDKIITNYKLVGDKYPKLYYPNRAILRATYNVGFTTETLPSDLKIAILDQVNYDYENRGVDVNDKGICEKTWRACQRWTRISPIL